MGAWIEISGDSVDGGTFTVAPLVGAWIEIQSRITRGLYQYVAPLVGAWIEINVGGHTSGVGCGSLLSWERGLKSDGSFGKHVRFARRSSRGSVD